MTTQNQSAIIKTTKAKAKKKGFKKMIELNKNGQKIRGIDKNICTAEQVIAYNIAHKDKDHIKRIFENCLAQDKRSILNHIFKTNIATIDTKKYNIDIIYLAFVQNMEKYIEKPFIAFSYEKIGEFFKAYII